MRNLASIFVVGAACAALACSGSSKNMTGTGGDTGTAGDGGGHRGHLRRGGHRRRCGRRAPAARRGPAVARADRPWRGRSVPWHGAADDCALRAVRDVRPHGRDRPGRSAPDRFQLQRRSLGRHRQRSDQALPRRQRRRRVPDRARSSTGRRPAATARTSTSTRRAAISTRAPRAACGAGCGRTRSTRAAAGRT